MRQIILSFSILAMIFSSCSKNTEVDQFTNNLNDVQNKSEWGLTKVLLTNFPDLGDIDCYPTTEPNCFDVIVIVGSTEQENMFYDLLPDIEENNREAISDFFDTQEIGILFPDLPSQSKSNIINGSEYLAVVNPKIEGNTDEARYLIMFVDVEDDDNISLVYQFEI